MYKLVLSDFAMFVVLKTKMNFKMKGVIKLCAIALFAAVVCGGCTMQDGSKSVTERATLELSQYAVELSNEAQAATPLVTVETNQDVVKVQSLAPDWVEAKYLNKKIYISAKPNQSGVKRATNLLVFAGTEFDIIKVTQKGSTLFLKVSPTEISVPANGETLLIDVKSNGEDWKFEVEEQSEEWLSVSRINDFLQIMVAPNTASHQRRGHIYVELRGTSPVEINVAQQAFNNGARFGLPLLEKKPTKHAIIDYEKKQGSYVVKYDDENYGSPLDIPYIVFLYASPVFKSVTYYIVEATKSIHQIEMVSNDAKTLMSDEFIQTLIDKGFEIKKKKGSQNYEGVSQQLGFKVVVEIKELKESKVIFTPLGA